MDNNKLNNSAYQNPATWKPSINLSEISIIAALITNKNKPKVTIVTGMVNNINIGFKKVFNKASTTATINAVVMLSTTIPVKNLDNKKTSTVEIISLISKFMFLFYLI